MPKIDPKSINEFDGTAAVKGKREKPQKGKQPKGNRQRMRDIYN